MVRRYFILFSLVMYTNFLISQTRSFEIVTQDVFNFWQAVDSLKIGSDTTKLFQTKVLDRASPAFKIFIKKWNIKAKDYTRQLGRYPLFYKTMRASTIRLCQSQDSIKKIVAQFQKLYPAFRNADICIGFGNFSTGGNMAIEGDHNFVYIGLEYHGLDSNTYIKELSISTQDYVSRSNFFRTIIHELVHVQQYSHGKKIKKALNGNLLANRIIKEGIPDYIGQLIVAGGNNGNYYDYGLLNENVLKTKLKNEMWNEGSSDWFGGDDKLFTQKPRDLGYFMGSRIGKNYFHSNQLKDLTQLIEIKNLKKFIDDSKYF
ncbi:MAG: hypothetical protein IPO92_03645 [Saprospiraceae bacterium]|nr:hypothetical protein [Saprospiraceae bacterium]